MGRTRDCHPSVRQGRLQKAEQFFRLAELGLEFAEDTGPVDDAVVTSLVHCGIAASDVICCAQLSKYSQGENHKESVALLDSVDPSSAKQLKLLLAMKTRSSYSDVPTSQGDLKRALRAAKTLFEAARIANTRAGG